MSEITIIHGIGEGVLKSEIQHLISLFDKKIYCQEINNGGGTKLFFFGTNRY